MGAARESERDKRFIFFRDICAAPHTHNYHYLHHDHHHHRYQGRESGERKRERERERGKIINQPPPPCSTLCCRKRLLCLEFFSLERTHAHRKPALDVSRDCGAIVAWGGETGAFSGRHRRRPRSSSSSESSLLRGKKILSFYRSASSPFPFHHHYHHLSPLRPSLKKRLCGRDGFSLNLIKRKGSEQ